MQEARHGGVTAVLHRLRGQYMWSWMVKHMIDLVQQCLRCLDTKARAIVPRSSGETVRSGWPGQALHLDYQYVEASTLLRGGALDERGVFRYILVIMDDRGNFIWLGPVPML